MLKMMERSQPKISELESAIRQLDSVKKHLYYTSSQVNTWFIMPSKCTARMRLCGVHHSGMLL